MTDGAAASGNAPKRRGRGPVAILLWVVAAVVLVVVSVTGFKTERRVETDSAFCAQSCHHDKAPPGDLHAKGHPSVACQSCHTLPLATGMKLLFQATFSKPEHPIAHGHVDAKSCESCHEKRPAEWRLTEETQGHRAHRAVKDVTCLSCHSSTSHVTEPAEKVCANCHKADRLHKPTTSADAETCLSCHSFAASAALAQPRTTDACTRCHADATKLAASAPASDGKPLTTVNEHALHGGVACQLCHNAHGIKAKPPEGKPVCARCHQFELGQVGNKDQRTSPEGHNKCEGCHKPHAPLASALKQCAKCHEKNALAIYANGTSSALKHKACTSCHQPHSWRAERGGCVRCHEEKAQMILTRSPPQHDTCTKCHEVHGPPPTGAVCVSCHSKTKGNHVALAPEKHKDCTSCHNPHAPTPKETRTSCAKCHTTQLSQVMRDGPEGHAKTTCFGCHKPHDNPLPPPDICSKCHAERALVVASAEPATHRKCASCHEKHVFKIRDTAATCSKCHDPAPPADGAPALASAAPNIGGIGPHKGDCKTCHTLHGTPEVPKAKCVSCHEKALATFNPPNPKHAVCRSCHTPHKPAKTALERCKSCHEAKATVALSWPAKSAHAQACNGCHTPHDVRVKKTCPDCHQAEVKSALGSKHQCVGCHAPHKAAPKPLLAGASPAWWTRCADCHQAKVESVKLRGPTHSECINCHKPHRFGVPECASCHTDMKSKGLHAVPKHAEKCTSCHDPHVKGLPERATCLTCHTNRQSHQPDAKRCQACHLFQ